MFFQIFQISRLHCLSHLSEPSSVVEHFKFQKDLGQFVEVLDDLLGFWHLQELALLFEDLHRFLDATIQLSGPGDLTCNNKKKFQLSLVI